MRVPLILFLVLTVASLSAAPITPSEHEIVLEIGTSFGVPRSITNQLQIEESGDWHTGTWGKADALGPKDVSGYRSRGLFQLNQRWQSWLVSHFYFHPACYFDWANPLDNAVVALGYLAALHRQFGSWEHALWFYNCGRITNIPESTRTYAARIVNAKDNERGSKNERWKA
jgi:hypothetical protein